VTSLSLYCNRPQRQWSNKHVTDWLYYRSGQLLMLPHRAATRREVYVQRRVEIMIAQADRDLFPGFTSTIVDVADTTIFIRRNGTGPPVLLLHGFPETHVMWHRVAPLLADDFTIVCADLRG